MFLHVVPNLGVPLLQVLSLWLSACHDKQPHSQVLMGSKQEDKWAEESCWNRHGDTGSNSLVHLEAFAGIQTSDQMDFPGLHSVRRCSSYDTRHTLNVGNLSPREIYG